MRYAVFSDLHANLPALNNILEKIKQLKCDKVINLGDSIAIGPQPRESIELLMAENVQSIIGNHEEYYLNGLGHSRPESMSDGEYQHQLWTHSQLNIQHREYIKSLPYYIEETVNNFRLLFIHSPFTKTNRFSKFINLRNHSLSEFPCIFSDYKYDFIFYGHSHQSLNIELDKNYINPGSVACHFGNLARFVTIDFIDDSYSVCHHRIPYDKDMLIDEMNKRSVPEKDVLLNIFYRVNNS